MRPARILIAAAALAMGAIVLSACSSANGPSTGGAKLRVRRSGRDFDPYLEVVVEFDDANQAARAYANRCDREAPTRWDQTAGTALGASPSSPRPLAER